MLSLFIVPRFGCRFQPNYLRRTSPCAWRPSSLSLASWSSFMSSSTSMMVSLASMAEARASQLNRWISSKDPSKMDTNYNMLQKTSENRQRHGTKVSSAQLRHRCGAGALRPSSPKLLWVRSTYPVLPALTHCNTFLLSRHWAISFPIRKMDRVPEGVVISKMLKLWS